MHRQYKCEGTSRWNRCTKNEWKAKHRPLKRGLTTKIHLICSTDKYAVCFHLSPGNNHDAPEGQKLIRTIFSKNNQYLLADRAYEDDETRALANNQGFIHVVPPKRNRKHPWKYNTELYKKRNQVERIFLRLKRFRRVFTCYDKLDLIYIYFIFLAFIFDSLFM